jgi:leucyl-tRNA---protein transferase
MDENLIFWEEPPISEKGISEAFNLEQMSLAEWEYMLSLGWRHNGKLFFRNSVDYDGESNRLDVLPIRYQLNQFDMSKSQRKIWRKNMDLKFRVEVLNVRDDMHAMFDQHKERFTYNVPTSLYDFVSPVTNSPFPTYQFELYKHDKLVACTFVDIMRNSLSSTYAMFDLEESKRSLGVFTMLLEMAYGIRTKKALHYPGYAFLQPSYMDYKKMFAGSEYYDWQTAQWFKL